MFSKALVSKDRTVSHRVKRLCEVGNHAQFTRRHGEDTLCQRIFKHAILKSNRLQYPVGHMIEL